MKHSTFKIGVFLFLVMFFFEALSLKAQLTTRQQLYRTFIAGRMDLWGEIIADFEVKTNLNTEAEKIELTNYCYGYIGYLLGVKRLKDAEIYLDKGQKLVDQIIEMNPDNPEAYAYKGAFLGFRISTDHSIAMILGPTSVYYIRKAYRLHPENLQAMIDMANFYFYAPGFFGGDVEKAIPLYAKAAALMESSGLSKENWRYFNLMILLAKANDKAGKCIEAERVYLKLLTVEPDFGWVKNMLLPDLKRRKGKSLKF